MAEPGYRSDPLVYPRIGRVRGPMALSSTWWGTAWSRTCEELAADPSVLAQGRALARSGRFGAVMVLAGMASAVWDPGSAEPMAVQVRVERFSADQWEGVLGELAREAGIVAALESGELPPSFVEQVDSTGAELLPGPAEIGTGCGCDSWAQPCVHAHGLLQQIGWHLDADPYALLLLRGRSREDLLDALVDNDRIAAGVAGTAAEAADAVRRARAILDLVEQAPTGHGLSDTAVAAYDEAVSRLLPAP